MALALLSARIAIAEETVLLKFDWPDVVRANVTLETTVVTDTGGAKHTVRGTTTFTLSAIPMSNQMLVIEESHRIVKRSYDGKDLSDPAEWLAHSKELSLLSQKTFIGKYVVSPDGAFVSIHDYVGMYCSRIAARRYFRKDDPKAAEYTKECREKIQKKSDPFLDYMERMEARRAQAGWTRNVAWWAGAELVEREVYETKMTIPPELPPEKGIPTTDTTKFIGRFPCVKGGPGSDCVRLELVELVDTGSEPRPLVDILDTILPEGTKPVQTVGSIRRRTEVHLLTDPETLLPRWVEELETISVVIEGAPESSKATSQKTHSIWTYEYEEPK